MSDTERMILLALRSWNQVIGRLDQALLTLTEEQLERQVAPEKSRLIYLLGHLTVTHDIMRVLLQAVDRFYPQLDRIFFDNPDQSQSREVSASLLKSAGTEVHRSLTNEMLKFSGEEWLERHTAESEADFQQDPTRNRIAILLSRTNHASFHLGQIVLVK